MHNRFFKIIRQLHTLGLHVQSVYQSFRLSLVPEKLEIFIVQLSDTFQVLITDLRQNLCCNLGRLRLPAIIRVAVRELNPVGDS